MVSLVLLFWIFYSFESGFFYLMINIGDRTDFVFFYEIRWLSEAIDSFEFIGIIVMSLGVYLYCCFF